MSQMADNKKYCLVIDSFNAAEEQDMLCLRKCSCFGIGLFVNIVMLAPPITNRNDMVDIL